jgi:hypothetical protein
MDSEFDSRPATWNVYYPKADRTSLREVALFEAEATGASKLLRRSWRYRVHRNWWRDRTPTDVWLSAAVSLADPLAQFQFGVMEFDGGKVESGEARRLASLSAVACKQLANGAKPKPVTNAGPQSAPPPAPSTPAPPCYPPEG